MLKLESVSKTYKHRRAAVAALENVSVEIRRGEYVALVGPSGSGKSTLLLMFGGMLAPTSGRVMVRDVSLFDLSVQERTSLRRSTIGYVFQQFNLIPYLTAKENVQTPLYLAGKSIAAQRERAADLLHQVGLGNRLDHKPNELSIGQQQRVALARTLANEPSVILADEPTGNLDPQTRTQVIDFLDRLHAEGRTIVLVTHDPTVAERSQRRIELQDGRIIEQKKLIAA
jgi:putative ABC transport system ATP-binding protein